jgi:formamidopyrimidine-DNA glycosylase
LADQLSQLLTGRIVAKINVRSGRYFRKPNDKITKFGESLPLKIVRIWCIGKRIFWEFRDSKTKDKQWLVCGLGMSGIWSIEEEKHSHVLFTLKPKKMGKNPEENIEKKTKENIENIAKKDEKSTKPINEIWFTDVRCFGTLDFYTDEVEFTDVMDEYPGGFLGEKIITTETFNENIIKCKKKYLVTSLMDQRQICSGVGNYILSEVMYRCRFHPDIRCNELTTEQKENLYTTIQQIMNESYKEGGMSMKNYQKPDGKKGNYMSSLRVYNKSHDPEGREVTPIKGRHGRTLWIVKELQKI